MLSQGNYSRNMRANATGDDNGKGIAGESKERIQLKSAIAGALASRLTTIPITMEILVHANRNIYDGIALPFPIRAETKPSPPVIFSLDGIKHVLRRKLSQPAGMYQENERNPRVIALAAYHISKRLADLKMFGWSRTFAYHEAKWH